MTTIQGPVPDPNRLGKTNKAQGDSDDSLKAKKTGGEAVVVDPEKVKRVAKKSAKDVPHIPRKAAAVDPRTGGWLDKKKVSTLVGSVKRSQAQVAELPKA
ncbi:MAG: hypothetical protein ACE5GN_06815, partial [Waddliaceae bacterium]